MKKIMIFAAVAALLSLSSCGKEEIKNAADASSNGSPVFTADINPGTKTTVDTQYGKVTWETSDVITITDGSGNTATYYISGIDASTGKATFEHSSGDELGAGPYSAVYGTQPEEAQTYSATAPGKLYMTASSENNVLTFNVQCALMEINLTKEGESVKKIEVTGIPEGEEETTYTLTCTEAVSIAETKAFYISLPAGTYTKIVITDSEGKVCTLNVMNQGIPVTVNQIIPATFAAGDLDFLPKGALPGEFSVGPNATDKVHFSKGNLYAKKTGENWTWNFYDEQYKYNSIATSSGSRTATANDTEIDLFTWGYDNTPTNNSYSLNPVNTAGISGHTTEGETFSKSEDWGCVFGGESSVWRTLTSAEWQYMFNTRSNASSLYKYGVTVCGKVNCVVLLPDNWQWDASTVGTDWQTDGYPATQTSNEVTWEKMEKAGAVCLPAAGSRLGSSVDYVGELGLYWSSTAYVGGNVCIVFFDSDYYFGPGNYDSRDCGYSVRLVTDVK